VEGSTGYSFILMSRRPSLYGRSLRRDALLSQPRHPRSLVCETTWFYKTVVDPGLGCGFYLLMRQPALYGRSLGRDALLRRPH